MQGGTHGRCGRAQNAKALAQRDGFVGAGKALRGCIMENRAGGKLKGVDRRELPGYELRFAAFAHVSEVSKGG